MAKRDEAVHTEGEGKSVSYQKPGEYGNVGMKRGMPGLEMKEKQAKTWRESKELSSVPILHTQWHDHAN